MALKSDDLQLYLVTDPTLCPGPLLVETVAAAVQGGVTFVQLRDKDASTRDRIEAARMLKDVLADTGIPLVINDDLDAAIAADVDGIHLGQDDVPPHTARQRLGSAKIIGLSCETSDQVRAADPYVVDYLGLGTVFPTSTKTDHKPTVGLAGLSDMVRLAQRPTVAIGGLKRDHVDGVLATGCDGIAVVSAICGQADPEGAARDLRRAIQARKKALS